MMARLGYDYAQGLISRADLIHYKKQEVKSMKEKKGNAVKKKDA